MPHKPSGGAGGGCAESALIQILPAICTLLIELMRRYELKTAIGAYQWSLGASMEEAVQIPANMIGRFLDEADL
jgi:hypothetical protein